jgi:hypothetical protein
LYNLSIGPGTTFIIIVSYEHRWHFSDDEHKQQMMEKRDKITSATPEAENTKSDVARRA